MIDEMHIYLNDERWQRLSYETRALHEQQPSPYLESDAYTLLKPFKGRAKEHGMSDVYTYMQGLLSCIDTIEVTVEQEYVRIHLPLRSVMPTTPFMNECLLAWCSVWRVVDRTHEVDTCNYLVRLMDLADMAKPKPLEPFKVNVKLDFNSVFEADDEAPVSYNLYYTSAAPISSIPVHLTVSDTAVEGEGDHEGD